MSSCSSAERQPITGLITVCNRAGGELGGDRGEAAQRAEAAGHDHRQGCDGCPTKEGAIGSAIPFGDFTHQSGAFMNRGWPISTRSSRGSTLSRSKAPIRTRSSSCEPSANIFGESRTPRAELLYRGLPLYLVHLLHVMMLDGCRIYTIIRIRCTTRTYTACARLLTCIRCPTTVLPTAVAALRWVGPATSYC